MKNSKNDKHGNKDRETQINDIIFIVQDKKNEIVKFSYRRERGRFE